MSSIQRFTVPSAELLSRMGALHFNDEVVIFDRRAFRHTQRVFCFPFAVIAFIDSGSAKFRMNDTDYHLMTNDQMLVLPQQEVLITHLSDDIHVRFVLLSHDFVNYITTDDTYLFIQFIRNNPVLHLQEHVTNAFCSCYDLIRATLLQTDNPYRRQMLQHIVKAFIYGIVYSIQPNVPVVRTREEEITYRFMDLVDRRYREQHELSFYANELHLTAKYVSKCVRLTTGKSALSCIIERLIRQAKAMLMLRQNTISHIAYELGFPDQSTFGKFFRRYEGISPSAWRENH